MTGAMTIAIAAAYFYWLHNIFVFWTGNDIFQGDIKNFSRLGAVPIQIIPPLRTLFKSCGYLLFIPLFSPWMLAGLAALAPLFVRGGKSFVEMQFQYSAPFIGFAIPALVDGLRRLKGWLGRLPGKWQETALSVLLILILFLNGGNFKTSSVRLDHLKTIQLAKSVPENSVVVTHGHLLPYIGYRQYNFYFQEPFEKPESRHPDKPVYDHADYYLLARDVNLYPMKPDFFEKKLSELKGRSDLALVHDDGARYLFKKK